MTDFRIPLETLKSLMIESATYNNVDDTMIEEYKNLRYDILKNYPDKKTLPKSLLTCSTLSQVRNYFQNKSNKYQERRSLIDLEFKVSLAFDNYVIDFEKAVDEIETLELNILPDEIKSKGREMSGAYYILYCIENSLRIFIDNIFTNKFGTDFTENINIPASINRAVQLRKAQEEKNAWLSIRGESDVFYMDFKELGDLILNNWNTFKDKFPDQAWIKSKIDELGSCRNLIAHNSYISEHERNVINVNYISIVKQISH